MSSDRFVSSVFRGNNRGLSLRGCALSTHFSFSRISLQIFFKLFGQGRPFNQLYMTEKYPMKSRFNLSVVLLGITGYAVLFACSPALAQDIPDGKFHGSASLGASFASGVVNSSNLSLKMDSVLKTADDKITVYGLIARGQTGVAPAVLVLGGVPVTVPASTIKTTDLYRLGGRYDRDLSKEMFIFGSGDLERNGIASLNLRTAGYAGAGLHVLATKTDTFDILGGIGYSQSKYKGLPTLGAAELMLGEESSHKLSDSTSFKQRFVLYPSLKSENGYRAVFDTSLAVAMGGGLSLNVGFSTRYANKVFVGKRGESLATVGAGYNF